MKDELYQIVVDYESKYSNIRVVDNCEHMNMLYIHEALWYWSYNETTAYRSVYQDGDIHIHNDVDVLQTFDFQVR